MLQHLPAWMLLRYLPALLVGQSGYRLGMVWIIFFLYTAGNRGLPLPLSGQPLTTTGYRYTTITADY